MTARITPRPQHGDVVIERDGQPTVLVVVRHRTGAPDAAGEALSLAKRIARLEALEAVAEAALDALGVWEGAICVADPPCGSCAACRLAVAVEALHALDAAEADHG